MAIPIYKVHVYTPVTKERFFEIMSSRDNYCVLIISRAVS